MQCCGSHSGHVSRDVCRRSSLYGSCVFVGVLFHELFSLSIEHHRVGLKTRSEVVSWIDEWSIEFGYHWLMLLMFLTANLFQFRFAVTVQYCNMALRLRCRRHEFSVVRLLSPACHLFSCELWYATDDVYFVARYQTSTHTTRWFPIRCQPSTATHIFTHTHCAVCLHSQVHPHTPGSRGVDTPGVIWHH